ncbi:MAG: amidohydrolase family protein, partial [archaeon]|nr:amidohydrolase family protein [archaeon]
GIMEAIKALTIYGAYQYFQEDIKGSITEGKLADLVILDRDPLTIPEDELKDIQILETIKEGEQIFKKK